MVKHQDEDTRGKDKEIIHNFSKFKDGVLITAGAAVISGMLYIVNGVGDTKNNLTHVTENISLINTSMNKIDDKIEKVDDHLNSDDKDIAQLKAQIDVIQREQERESNRNNQKDQK